MVFLAAHMLCLNAWSTEYLSLKSFLKEGLGSSGKLTQESFNLNADQQKELKAVAENATEKSLKYYFSRDPKGELLRACTVLAQAGKEGPMSVGVCFDNAGLVQNVSVLQHEEEHGKGIEKNSFVNQFKGKGPAAPFIVGKDIHALTGATRSSEAVSEAVRKATYGFKTFVKGKEK